MGFTVLDRTNYADFFIDSLRASGAKDLELHRLSGSRLTVKLERAGIVRSYRVLLFAVSGSGRSKPQERRVEITSTYAGKNLEEFPGHSDLVVGIDREGQNLVGIDARRLRSGGSSHNASTFVYLPAFDIASSAGYYVFINDRQNLFEKEYQIYFRPSFALNYLIEVSSLHGSGLRQTPQAHVKDDFVDKLDVLAAAGSKTKLTYEQQVEITLKKMEIGRAGEAFVMQQERARLTAAGREDLAKKVEWISQTYPYVGYDISTFNASGTVEYIEVKSSIGLLDSFFISQNELNKANKYKERYRIACVSHALTSATMHHLCDPAQMISDGNLSICAVTHRITL